MNKCRSGIRRPFTAIELIIVITVLSIIAWLLLPALKAAKERSRRIDCVSNLRQTTAAALAYSSDYAEYPAACDKSLPPDWLTAYGQGHFWKTLLANGRYSTNDVMSCTGNYGSNYGWEVWHAGDTEPGQDGHFYYGGPLSSGGYSVWDITQTSWPAGSGYQPQQQSLIRDVNVKLATGGVRTLFICPTMMIAPWGTQGWIMREPHGLNPGIAWWTPSSGCTMFSAYERNCAFTDGHVESRSRTGSALASSADAVCPWMDGNYSYNSPTNQDPAQ